VRFAPKDDETMPRPRKPELHVIKFADSLGADWRAERERHRAESRRRYTELVAGALADTARVRSDDERAAMILDRLTVSTDITSGEPCPCSCHPALPTGDLHDYGFACRCQQAPEERRRFWDNWDADNKAFWASAEGQCLTAQREADEDELARWLEVNPEIEIDSHGGMFPEQWWGTVDGHSFYFRERHGEWRIELDLRPSGRSSNVYVGGDLDDPASLEEREIEIGDVVAEGTTSAENYGQSPVERLQFIVGAVRGHFRRAHCSVHTAERDDLELLFGRPLVFCPACGTELSALDKPGGV
jgi:hypothetical protein